MDEDHTILQELNGFVRPNRLECPETHAILTNKLNIDQLKKEGRPEIFVAKRIHKFLKEITDAHGDIPMVGFNSAKFDFKHYEKLSIKFGINPTLGGKIKSLDVLQYAKHLAINNLDTFPFTKVSDETTNHVNQRFCFKFETLAKRFNCYRPQKHEAKDDCLLTMELVHAIESNYDYSLKDFYHDQLNTDAFNAYDQLLIHKKFEFHQNEEKPVTKTSQWVVIGKASNHAYNILNIDDFFWSRPKEMWSLKFMTKQVNVRNSAFIVKRKLIDKDLTDIIDHPDVQTLMNNPKNFYDYFPNSWDIEYVPWKIGVENIPRLYDAIARLQRNFLIFDELLYELADQIKQTSIKRVIQANVLAQLFRRFYINTFPKPDQLEFERMCYSRYISNGMYRDLRLATCPLTELDYIDDYVKRPETSEDDKKNLLSLRKFLTDNFIHTISMLTMMK